MKVQSQPFYLKNIEYFVKQKKEKVLDKSIKIG